MSFEAHELLEKWSPVLDDESVGRIENYDKRLILATLLENQVTDQSAQGELGGTFGLLGEAAPTNAMGMSSSTAGDGSVDIFDPILISLVRRSMPNLVSYDVMGVQPMTGPTGLIFALRSRYNNQTGVEALYNEANTSFAAASANTLGTNNRRTGPTVRDGQPGDFQVGGDPTTALFGNNYTVSHGMGTASAEALGDSRDNDFAEMAMSVEKVNVTAVTRALKAEYTMELAQDLKAIHGLDAETELSRILSGEIITEINREMIRTINYTATNGARTNTATAGTFDLDVDANGRWSVERFKGLIFQIERECNAVAKATRRGKGNVMICSSDVASALQMAGVLDYTPRLSSDLNVDDTGNTFAGVLNGRVRVHVDPYFASNSGMEYCTVGYKGQSPFDAGLFYCPYVPLQMVRAIGEQTFQPKIGFKTRYGLIANPFATRRATGAISRAADDRNIYYRLIAVRNLM